MEKKTTIFLTSIIIAVISISVLISAEADLLFIFTFDTTVEGFVHNDPGCAVGSFAGSFDDVDGNGVGSLLSAYTRGGGSSASCDNFWDWTGTWEDLGVSSGDLVDGLDGQFDYLVPSGDVDTWAVGALELRTSTGSPNCGGVTATLEIRQPDTSGTQTVWTTVNNKGTENFPAQTSSDDICIRINGHITGGANDDNEMNFDNIQVIIADFSSTDPNARQPQSAGGFISNGWVKLNDYELTKP
jgi:hypothetical protein